MYPRGFYNISDIQTQKESVIKEILPVKGTGVLTTKNDSS